ncbi:MAG TPA: glycosyltransferase, partial [Candidatus Binatus sp.]|nr:glycosyltransferase [Candidatus Binatus sp.]
IREGEEHQAELLSWQCRAAFELGLSGFIVFAFTDEWHTGGAEITDWAFGLTRRDRTPKLAFDAVGKVFSENLPPMLTVAPKATVVVAAYNAASTLSDCLSSIRELNYPNYETIVVDDGSTDSTSEIANRDSVRTIRIEHKGLAAARNAGVEAASGEIVAFIDADARADRDWLYHLVETIKRRDAAAAAGPNFAPDPQSARAAAMAAAPGLPREVRAGDDRLAQLCGCNMAITKAALLKAGGFDPMFTTAGDDVDLSWRLAALKETLAYAPGAVVIHKRRATLAAYLRQQSGYGTGEGLLYRKYPPRTADHDGIYAGASSIGALLGGARVYYGEFGRGLFQTVYSAGSSYVDLPLTVQWVGLSLILLILGTVNRVLGVLGAGGIALSILAAALGAASVALPRSRSGPLARMYLWIINLLGPSVRSFARERIKWRFEPATDIPDSNGPVKLSGQIEFVISRDAPHFDSATILAAMRDALIRRGIAVAETDGFQSYDLELLIPPMIRAPINALRKDASIALIWRIRPAPRRVLIAAAVTFLVLLAAGFSLGAAIVGVVIAALAVGLIAINRARRVSAIIKASAAEVASSLGISIAKQPVDEGR